MAIKISQSTLANHYIKLQTSGPQPLTLTLRSLKVLVNERYVHVQNNLKVYWR